MPADNAARSTTGGRTRAGNGMSRARAGILSGAATCVARFGTRKTTMGDIAREGGVAKATLYNHFRTKDDVLGALATHEVESLLAAVDDGQAQPGTPEAVSEALAAAATVVAEHPVLRQLAVTEPGLVATLLTPSRHELWQRARSVARDRLSLAQAAGGLHPQHGTEALVDAALRWVVSHALWPATAEEIRAGAHRVVHGMVAAPRGRVVADGVDGVDAGMDWTRAVEGSLQAG